MNAQEVLDMLYDEWQKTRNFTMTPGATAPQQDHHAEYKIPSNTRKFSLY